MAAVTQAITNYIGGVSRQSDQKKLPGQVRECLNALPDPTFGLRKRPGTKFIKQLLPHADEGGSTFTSTNAKWFSRLVFIAGGGGFHALCRRPFFTTTEEHG